LFAACQDRGDDPVHVAFMKNDPHPACPNEGHAILF
jgi:hypothetical protein